MPRASMRLTGTAAGDLRRPWRASSAVSCESRGGFVVLTRRSTAEGASQSGGLVSLFFFSEEKPKQNRSKTEVKPKQIRSKSEANPKQSGEAWQWIRSGHTLFNRLTVVQ